MNSPEEKAQELYGKFYEAAAVQMFNEQSGFYIDREESASNAKACMVICVDEIIAEHTNHNAVNWSNQREERKGYWQKVKDCISKL